MLFKSKTVSKRLPKQSFVKEWFNSIVFAVVAATLIRWTTVEAFVVPTPSMENTILVGDYLFVSKFHYGTRTTTTPLQIPLMHQKITGTEIPSYLNWIDLPSYRLPGISEVKRGDVVVFNVPPVSLNEGKVHPVQLKTNYVKRCVALPGDELIIRDQQIIINGIAQPLPDNMKFAYTVVAREEVTARSFKSLSLDGDDFTYLGKDVTGKSVYNIHMTQAQTDAMRALNYVASVTPLKRIEPESDIFPQSENAEWNGDNYGPLTIPRKGMTIDINDSTLARYGQTMLDYENGKKLTISNGYLFENGKQCSQYTFSQDYYFMVGDNRHNSLDSRYWGFVPEDHIVGKALFIWMSLDSEANMLNKIRWNRLFTMIE